MAQAWRARARLSTERYARAIPIFNRSYAQSQLPSRRFPSKVQSAQPFVPRWTPILAIPNCSPTCASRFRIMVPVTFKWFMQQALYHPQHGYYGGGRARIGRRGDFYTSVSVGKIFGELMAKQFEEIWYRMNTPVSFAIVEEGANNGQFAQDVLGWLQQFSPDLYQRVRYWIVEPTPHLQQEQQATSERMAAQQNPLDPQPDHLRGGFSFAACTSATNC